MKTTDSILLILTRLPKGYVFTYVDFLEKVNKKEAVIKALNRLAASGKIAKLTKGKFFKPESSEFGLIQPTLYQEVKDLLEKDGRIIGYLTGYSLYNQLGLTTQVSNAIQIGKNEIRAPFKRGRRTISFIKQKNIIVKSNIMLLQLLDTIRYIKKIPDTSVVTACKRLKAIIQNLSKKDKFTIVRLAQKYPPLTRALLGVLFEATGNVSLIGQLKKSLNPITIYKLSGVNKFSSFSEKWNFK